MSIYKVFAANLRARCARFESIESVCRGAKVNRQQFNKYLAGRALPQARTLQRICRFLDVDDISLFCTQGAGSAAEPAATAGELISPSLEHECPLPLGHYLCYFPLQHFDTHLVVSTLCLHAKAGKLYFARRTLFRSPSNPKVIVAKGRHRGAIVVQDAGIYLVGVNAGKPAHPSLVFLDANQLPGGSIHVGLSLTRGSRNPMASRIVVKYVGPSLRDARTCLRATTVISTADAALDPLVALTFSRSRQDEALQINVPLIEESLRSPPEAARTSPAARRQAAVRA